MKTLVAAIAVLLLLGSTTYGGWYVAPRAVYAYYPAAPVYAYPAPVVVRAPYVAYAPVVQPPIVVPAPVLAPAPYVTYAPVVAPRIVVAAPAWVGPPAVVVRSKVYIPGRPVRNVVRAVLP